MSSRKTGTLKEKSSIGSGILALVRKKSKSKLPSENKRESSGPAKPVEVSGAESIVETIEFKPNFFEVEEESQVLKELGEQLTETQNRLSDAHLKSQENQQTIDQLQIRLSDLGQNNSCAQNKLKEMAEEKDAEITILKQQVEDLHQQLQNRQDLSNKVQRLTDEVTELQTQNQELRFQHERSSTRTRINSISEEKYTKEEVLKLQKELRMAERNMKIETANFEAQLKAAQDGNERLLDKVRISQLRFDELDKEKLDLKIEINRLQKKLEKSGSYSELKRLQTEQESVELELRNLKRKNMKLEKQLTNSNHIVNGHDNQPNGDLYPSRSKLSTSKATYLEKEISELESTVTKLKSENKKLEERADSAQQTSEVLTLKVKQLDEQLQAEKIKVQATEASFGELKKAAAGSAGEEYLEGLLKQIESLNQASKDVETNFKVKEKDLWSTIEAQKKQIEELEMEKLALELGDVEGSDNEKESTPNPQISEKMVELESELDRLRKSKAELERNLNEVKEELMQSSQTESSTEKYKIEIDKKHNELTELRQDNEHLKKAIEEEIARIRELEELSTALQATNRDQLKKLEEFEGKDKAYSALENEKKSLAKQLQDLQAINKSLKKKLEEVEAAANQVPTLKSEIQKLTKQVADIKKSKSKEDGKKVSFDEISVLEKEVEKLTKANAQLMTDLEAAEDEIDHREDTRVKIKDERDKLLKEKQKLKADLELAEDELEKLDVELVQQTGKLLEQISQLKKENSEVNFFFKVHVGCVIHSFCLHLSLFYLQKSMVKFP